MVDLSSEAIQNIASVYNKDNLKATNIEATNNLIVTDKKIMLHGPQDANHSIGFDGKYNGPVISGYAGGVLRSADKARSARVARDSD